MAEVDQHAELSTLPPETHLFRLREHCHRILKNSKYVSAAAIMAAQMFLALDASLCNDEGELPLDWSQARRSLVLNGLPKQPTWTGFTHADAFTEDEEGTEV